jgi:cytidylate kinase
MDKINIALDGHSSCGKSTIAKALAKKLNYVYVDSGAMYRSVTLYAMEKALIDKTGVNLKKLIDELNQIHITFKIINGNQHTFLNDKDVEFDIRTQRISENVSQVAKIPEVRMHLVKQQQFLGRSKGVVMDGRDIGSVVFPNAEVKFFVTANVNVRAQRRFDEMIANNHQHVSFEEIKQNLEERDFVDSHRETSPLIQAEDAIMIDTSDLSPEDQLNFVYSKVLEKINNI